MVSSLISLSNHDSDYIIDYVFPANESKSLDCYWLKRQMNWFKIEFLQLY